MTLILLYIFFKKDLLAYSTLQLSLRCSSTSAACYSLWCWVLFMYALEHNLMKAYLSKEEKSRTNNQLINADSQWKLTCVLYLNCQFATQCMTCWLSFSRFKREEIKIQAWENHQQAKTEAEMRKTEVINYLLHVQVSCFQFSHLHSTKLTSKALCT